MVRARFDEYVSEGGHFYKQVFSGIKLNADTEAAAAALTAAALLQAEGELLTADQALTDAQSASDAAKAVVAEITEAQRLALEALFPGGDMSGQVSNGGLGSKGDPGEDGTNGLNGMKGDPGRGRDERVRRGSRHSG